MIVLPQQKIPTMSSTTSSHQRGVLEGDALRKVKNGTKVSCYLNYKALNIIWGGPANKDRYWKTIKMESSEGGNEQADVVELVGVYWLEVSGKIPLTNLTPSTKYKLTFTVQLREGANGWNNYPVIFKVRIPGQPAVSSKQKLNSLAKDKWIEVPGDGLLFTTPDKLQDSQVLTFAMYEIECEDWKDKLIVEGVKIRPV